MAESQSPGKTDWITPLAIVGGGGMLVFGLWYFLKKDTEGIPQKFKIDGYHNLDSGETAVTPETLLANDGDRIQVFWSYTYEGPAVDGIYHVAFWQKTWWDPHDELSPLPDIPFHLEESSSPQKIEADATLVVEGFDPKAYGLYVKIGGIAGEDYHNYLPSVIDVAGGGNGYPETDIRDIHISVTPGGEPPPPEYPTTDIRDIHISVTPGGTPPVYPTTDIRDIHISVAPGGGQPPPEYGNFGVGISDPLNFPYAYWAAHWDTVDGTFSSDPVPAIGVAIPKPPGGGQVPLTGKLRIVVLMPPLGYIQLYGPTAEYTLVNGGAYRYDRVNNKIIPA